MQRLEETEMWPPILAKLQTTALRELAIQHGVSPGQIGSAMRRTGITRRPIRVRRDASSPRHPALRLIDNTARSEAPVRSEAPSRRPRTSAVPVPLPAPQKPFVWTVYLADDSTLLARGVDLQAVSQVLARMGISDIHHVERLGELIEH